MPTTIEKTLESKSSFLNFIPNGLQKSCANITDPVLIQESAVDITIAIIPTRVIPFNPVKE